MTALKERQHPGCELTIEQPIAQKGGDRLGLLHSGYMGTVFDNRETGLGDIGGYLIM